MSRYCDSDPVKRKMQLSESHLKSITNCIIDYNITRIEPQIHRIKLSGEKIKGQKMEGLYDYDSFKKTFPAAQHISDFISDERMPLYKYQLKIDYGRYIINIFYFRRKGCYPPFCMEVTPKGKFYIADFKKILKDLNKLYPNMCVSSIEYAIDVFCDYPKSIEWLYYLIRRALYVPYAKGARQLPEKTTVMSDKFSMCYTQHYGGDTKIYLRGDDEDKEDGTGWHESKFNRVRFEFTANRRELSRHSIHRITDLLRDCMFHKINEKVYHFRRFKGDDRYPQYYESDWSNYTTEDMYGNKGAFQNEYEKAAKDNETKNNYRKYSIDIEDLEPLKRKIIEVMKGFDIAWRSASII